MPIWSHTHSSSHIFKYFLNKCFPFDEYLASFKNLRILLSFFHPNQKCHPNKYALLIKINSPWNTLRPIPILSASTSEIFFSSKIPDFVLLCNICIVVVVVLVLVVDHARVSLPTSLPVENPVIDDGIPKYNASSPILAQQICSFPILLFKNVISTIWNTHNLFRTTTNTPPTDWPHTSSTCFAFPPRCPKSRFRFFFHIFLSQVSHVVLCIIIMYSS